GEGGGDVVAVARHHDPDRLDLIDRGVGAVAAAAECVEQHLAAQALTQAGGEGGITGTMGRQRHGIRMKVVPIACKKFVWRWRAIAPLCVLRDAPMALL